MAQRSNSDEAKRTSSEKNNTSETRTTSAKASSKTPSGKSGAVLKKKKTGTQKKVKKVRSDASYVLQAVIIILVAVLLSFFYVAGMLASFSWTESNISGAIGQSINDHLLGAFGFPAYFIPAFMVYIAVMAKKLSQSKKFIKNVILISLCLVFLASLVHIIVYDGIEESPNLPDIFWSSAALAGGGVIGGYIGWGLVALLAQAGGIVVCVIVILILLALLLGADRLAILWNNTKNGVGKTVAQSKKSIKKKRDAKKQSCVEKDDEEDEEEDTDDEESLVFDGAPDAKVASTASGTIDDEEDILLTSNEDEEIIDNTVFGESYEDEEEEDEGSEYGFTTFNFSDGDAGREELGQEMSKQNYVVDRETGEIFQDEDGLFDEEDDEEMLDMTELDGEVDKLDRESESAESAEIEKPAPYAFPPIDLLTPGKTHYAASQDEINQNIAVLKETLGSFKIGVREITCACGPTLTRFEVKPEAGVRVRAIANLVDDIALGLAKSGVRIEAPIPGKAAIGIEVPNDNPSTVNLRNLIEAPEFKNHKSNIAACLGADVSGRPVIFDIEKMPHLLIAGATGMGKSVCINSIITSILYKANPNDVKLVLIDPKKVEFNIYKDIPHLACKIISDPKKAAGALNSAVNEMEKRFELIERVEVRNIAGYNEAIKDDPDMPYMPRMVIIIDELADLMMSASDDVETAICRIAQKARAAGIHLIIGTQRPSVDVITGLIKANIPSRIAFTVSSGVDSRTIIDTVGAEKLIGRGDMLYAPVGISKPMRVQGSFISDSEVNEVAEFVRTHNAPVRYDGDFERSIDEEAAKCGNPARDAAAAEGIGFGGNDEDAKLYEALRIAVENNKISTSLLQRKLKIGYGRAAKIIDDLEERGYVGPADGNKPREILITAQDLTELMMNEGQ